jgi:hypothetical protein
VKGSCEYGNESSGSIKCSEIFEWLRNWRLVSFTTPPALPRGKNPRYSFCKRLGGPQSRSGRYGEEKILVPAGN